MSTLKRPFDMIIGKQGNLRSPTGREFGENTIRFPRIPSPIRLGKGWKMSETNPPPTTNPPAETPPQTPPLAPVATPPATPPVQAPAAPDLSGVLTRLETVITGLPERTANAVREVSPQHVPNPTANPAGQQTPGQQQQDTNPVGGGKKTGPGRVAKWFFGMND